MNRLSIKPLIYLFLFSFLTIAIISCEDEDKVINQTDKSLKSIPESSVKVGDIFETISGNLSFEEILSNENEFGHIWNMQLDKERDILYAFTSTNLLKIDLKKKAFGSILDSTNIAYKDYVYKAFKINKLPINSIPEMSVNANGELFCVLRNNSAGDVLNIDNWLKINPSKNEASIIGRTTPFIHFRSFQASNKKFYTSAFTTSDGYHVSVYDEKLQNSKIVIPKQSGYSASTEYITSIQELPNNKIRFLSAAGFYADVVDDEQTATATAILASKEVQRNSDDLRLYSLGMDYSKHDYYLLKASTSGSNPSKKPIEYIIGRAKADITNPFENAGEFRIKKSLEYESKTYYWGAIASAYTVFTVANNGDMYLLIHHPNAVTAERAPELNIGGIYKISIK